MQHFPDCIYLPCHCYAMNKLVTIIRIILLLLRLTRTSNELIRDPTCFSETAQESTMHSCWVVADGVLSGEEEPGGWLRGCCRLVAVAGGPCSGCWWWCCWWGDGGRQEVVVGATAAHGDEAVAATRPRICAPSGYYCFFGLGYSCISEYAWKNNL